jgi:hypothetical protein
MCKAVKNWEALSALFPFVLYTLLSGVTHAPPGSFSDFDNSFESIVVRETIQNNDTLHAQFFFKEFF